MEPAVLGTWVPTPRQFGKALPHLASFALRYSYVEFTESATNHVEKADVEHAIAHPLRIANLEDDDGRVLVVVPHRAGNPLEVFVQERFDQEPIVFHAMPLRARYHYLLPD